MLLLEIRTYEGEVRSCVRVDCLDALSFALESMREIAKQWKAEGGTLDSCRLLNLSTTGDFDEEDGEPDNVVAFVDENLRNPVVFVGKRLEEAQAMLRPN